MRQVRFQTMPFRERYQLVKNHWDDQYFLTFLTRNEGDRAILQTIIVRLKFLSSLNFMLNRFSQITERN
jgi:hypothetical protein